jgi:hypothetical protein
MLFIKHQTIIVLSFLLLITLTMSECKKDSSPAATTTYQLPVKDQLGVSGTIKFTQTSSTVTTVTITLTGSDSAYHPAYIRSNSAVEGGAIAITLTPVIGGSSTTQVTRYDNGSAINYSQLIQIDGYVDVDESNSNQSLIIAEGDIGGNLLTGTTTSYALDTIGTNGVSGTALFAQRVNGNTLVSVSLTGTLAGGVYPAGIYLGSVATVGGGPLTKTLTSVTGTSGKSYTNVRSLDNGTVVTYTSLLAYDGYIAILQSATASTIICDGNIGAH